MAGIDGGGKEFEVDPQIINQQLSESLAERLGSIDQPNMSPSEQAQDEALLQAFSEMPLPIEPTDAQMDQALADANAEIKAEKEEQKNDSQLPDVAQREAFTGNSWIDESGQIHRPGLGSEKPAEETEEPLVAKTPEDKKD